MFPIWFPRPHRLSLKVRSKMSRQVNPLEANEWSKQELKDNVRYLSDRGDMNAINTVKETLGAKKAEAVDKLMESWVGEQGAGAVPGGNIPVQPEAAPEEEGK